MMTWVVSFFFSCFIYFKLPRKKNETRGDRNIPNDRSKITENRPPPYASLPPPGKQSKISNEIEFNLLIKST